VAVPPKLLETGAEVVQRAGARRVPSEGARLKRLEVVVEEGAEVLPRRQATGARVVQRVVEQPIARVEPPVLCRVEAAASAQPEQVKEGVVRVELAEFIRAARQARSPLAAQEQPTWTA
jgi:hypothetical protein